MVQAGGFFVSGVINSMYHTAGAINISRTEKFLLDIFEQNKARTLE